MKFVKSISLFFVYPMVLLLIGMLCGVWGYRYFYPGDTAKKAREEAQQELLQVEDQQQVAFPQETVYDGEAVRTATSSETLCVDTEYVLEETDVVRETVVETTWKLPDKYIGMNREQFIESMENYEAFPPLSEVERGFIGLEVLSFSRERVVVQMNYQYLQPTIGFFIAALDNEIVVYLEDKETIYINTGIPLEGVPEEIQMQIIQMLWVEDEESLYNFLETYTS